MLLYSIPENSFKYLINQLNKHKFNVLNKSFLKIYKQEQ